MAQYAQPTIQPNWVTLQQETDINFGVRINHIMNANHDIRTCSSAWYMIIIYTWKRTQLSQGWWILLDTDDDLSELFGTEQRTKLLGIEVDVDCYLQKYNVHDINIIIVDILKQLTGDWVAGPELSALVFSVATACLPQLMPWLAPWPAPHLELLELELLEYRLNWTDSSTSICHGLQFASTANATASTMACTPLGTSGIQTQLDRQLNWKHWPPCPCSSATAPSAGRRTFWAFHAGPGLGWSHSSVLPLCLYAQHFKCKIYAILTCNG